MTNVVNYLNNEQSKKDGKAKKQNYETVSNYISFLEDAFVILRADRYDVKGKEILKGAGKSFIPNRSLGFLFAVLHREILMTDLGLFQFHAI